MNKTTHTPGPWKWLDDFGRMEGTGKPILKNALGEGPQIGQCSPFSYCVIDPDGFVVVRCMNPMVTMSTERSVANARLVSAAPDLLEACQELLRTWGAIARTAGSHEARQAGLKAEAAIAKAIGGNT